LRYTTVDAFSGAGGLSLGLTQAGLEIIYSFDADSFCIQTQKRNSKYFPHLVETAKLEDLSGQSLLFKLNLKPQELFLLAGGPPCQGFSVQRIGDDVDGRNDLVLQFVELVQHVRPHYFLLENVPGLKGKRGKEVLDLAVAQIRKFGYYVALGELDAQNFGVPQRRKRIFLLAERDPSPLIPLELPAPQKKPAPSVRETIAHLPPPPADGTDHPSISLHRADRLSDLNKKRLRALAPGQGREHLPPELVANCHKRSSAEIGHRNVYGRMEWDTVAPTITARFDSFTRGMFGHPEQLRTISLREGAMLQTFPMDFEFIGGKVEIARQIGNAVPVRLASALGRHILRHHERKLQLSEGIGLARSA
jgi:DNA (cytosine-5)-methyltransferase 1